MTTFDASKHRRDARGRFAAMQGSEPTVVFGSDDDTSSAQRPGGTSDVSLDRFDNADAPPTYVDELGNKLWEVDGKSHRSGGLPAVERADGAVEFWVDGGRHRDDGLPAVVEPTGYKEYWVNDRLHRANGLPAIEGPNGYQEFWVGGERIASPENGRKIAQEHGIDIEIHALAFAYDWKYERDGQPGFDSNTAIGLDLSIREVLESKRGPERLFTYGVGGDCGQQEFGSDIPDSSESYGPVADVRMALEDRASEIFRRLPDWGEQPVSDTRTPQWVVDLLGYDPETAPPATQA